MQKDAFIVNGKPHDVPCIAQIWSRRPGEPTRADPTPVDPIGFSYVASDAVWHLGVRRVGGKAGSAYFVNEGPLSKQSHYFLAFDERFLDEIGEIKTRLNAHTFPTNTTGPRSLSKNEVSCVVNAVLQEI